MPRFLTPHVGTLCVVLEILLILKYYLYLPFILECLLTFDSGQQVIFILKEYSRLKIDCEKSLFFFRFSKGSARPRECWAAKPRDARNEGGSPRRKKRDWSPHNAKYDWLMREALTTNCQQSVSTNFALKSLNCRTFLSYFLVSLTNFSFASLSQE